METWYKSIGHDHKLLTIIFEMGDGVAFIITAYPSTDSQRKLYKAKRK